jgi:thiol-disulfide isomerase/thioredoxin
MSKQILLSMLAIMLGFTAFAKDGYKINITLTNNNDSMVYLCHYYGKGQTVYKDDSAKITKGTSKVTLAATKKLIGGIYMLWFGSAAPQFEFILSNGDEFGLEIDKTNMNKSAKFTGSDENTKFYEYQNYLGSIGERYQAINNELSSAKTKADTNKVNEKSKKLSAEMKDYRNEFCKKYPTTFTSTIFNALAEPEVPEKDPMLADGKTKDSTFRYRTFKGQYWSRFNFADDRIICTPIYEKKLEDYFKLIVPAPDSMNKEADMLLAKTKNSPELFKYSLWWITRYAETSKVMGMDESFVYLVENYYQKGMATWLEDTSLEKYIDRAKKIAPNMVGQPAIDVRLPDAKGTITPLSTIYPQNDYTLLVFWSPTCGHCQKEIPRVDSVAKIISKKVKFKVYGVETDLEDEKWEKLIKENDLNKNWVHVHDPNRTSNFRATYDVYSTPVMYLIDKSGKIVGKKLDNSNIEGLIDFLEKKKKGASK